MYVRGGARIVNLIWRDRLALIALAIMGVAAELLEPYFPRTELFSVSYVAVLSTALSIFLVFRFNEAYERWWEARKLWGRLVNLSRDFARQATTLLPGNPTALCIRLVYGQIAFVHALRISLRQGVPEKERTELEPILRRLLPDEREQLLRQQNIPARILQRQSELVAASLSASASDAVRLARFDSNLGELFDVQGSCERIKNTPFPENVAVITRVLIWGLALLLYVATIEPGGRQGILTTIGAGMMAMGYIWIDSLGKDLKDPFNCGPSDTPMTALSVNVERDLREMLGETELPPLPIPRHGVLM